MTTSTPGEGKFFTKNSADPLFSRLSPSLPLYALFLSEKAKFGFVDCPNWKDIADYDGDFRDPFNVEI